MRSRQLTLCLVEKNLAEAGLDYRGLGYNHIGFCIFTTKGVAILSRKSYDTEVLVSETNDPTDYHTARSC